MDTQWFNNPKFRELCVSNSVEPVLSGDRLVLICPKFPDKQTAETFAELIPQELEWGFCEGLQTATMASIKVMLLMFRVPMVAFKSVEGGRAILLIPPVKGTATQPGSPLWDQIVILLKKDPFTKTFEIRVGCCAENPEGEVYRDSEGYIKPDTAVAADIDGEVEENGPVHQESPLLTAAKKGVVPKITDDRFNYDKEFLPKDVATDVKILLESCNSVEEFLKSI